MHKITTLGKVFNRVDALSQNCFDQHIDVKDLSFDNLDSVKIAGEVHPMRTIAQRSITWRCGIPYQYLRKCPPDIQALNMNYWIEHEKNDELFFRYDGEDEDVRAIFTTKFLEGLGLAYLLLFTLGGPALVGLGMGSNFPAISADVLYACPVMIAVMPAANARPSSLS